MSKAEEFISDCTRNYSNEYLADSKSDGHGGTISKRKFNPWLTPDQARKAVEIAREEMIDKVCEWLKKNVTYTHPRKGTEECIINLVRLKDAMRNE